MSRRTTIALSTAGLLAAGAALALAVRPARHDVPDVAAGTGSRRPPRVVIAGGGYVGFCVARALRAQLNLDQVEIACIDSRAYLTYQPFLPEVAAGSIQPRHVVAPHRRNLDGVTIITGAVTAIDHAGRTVTVRPPTPQSTHERVEPYTLTYDHLVIALGAAARTLRLALGLLLLALKPAWWAWALVFGPLTGVGLWLAWKRRERSLLSGLVTVLAAAALPLVLGSEGPLHLDGLPVLAGLSLACFGYFFGTVFYVKTNVRERGRVSYIAYSVTWHAACAMLFALVDFHLPRWWLVAFFITCTLRAWLVPSLGVMKGRKVTTKQLGYTEMIATAALLAILIPGALTA